MDRGNFIGGFVTDALGKFVPTVAAETTIGVCLRRFSELPTSTELLYCSQQEPWFLFHRDDGQRVFFMGELEMKALEVLVKTPKGQETLHLAIELALHYWPEWCPDLRADSRFKPREFVPLPNGARGTAEA